MPIHRAPGEVDGGADLAEIERKVPCTGHRLRGEISRMFTMLGWLFLEDVSTVYDEARCKMLNWWARFDDAAPLCGCDGSAEACG